MSSPNRFSSISTLVAEPLSFQNQKLRLKTVMEYPYKAIKGRALY
ncbi:hypothetical protein VC0101557_06360 [Vibrio cholerae VC0101557]|uniref:Uncharacterized protein n=2 Tax=Vibrio cholerae TaxID=666 RepID=A0A0X1L4I6_VIBCO|nr:hypothetical protein VC0395_A2598 [Vibrio cholerae O395]AET28064.1 conserved hypothetical protein [Vibrio cholerae O1 str. 2010EL-1786]APF47835.1 hypothetical protein ASZ80_00233 [Vibrio cholerae]EAZ72025.1 hypothetical protein A5C_0226 [Vibrio cholerae NCTC 8457]EET25466.1 conserved hypothetical protein [Vibrio cholerae MO10]EGR03959.1 conserved domain protein [Vibrio cholerae HE39]EGR06379.1 conserved domain protein [Vibrio cholerae HCUF01]EGR06781.1 conserved domain protein [Vibrio cho